MTEAITASAAAKVNLTLHITGRRDDGFHILESLISFTEITDKLTFRPAKDIQLNVSGPEAAGIQTNERNLVVRAARLIQAHTETTQGAHISLEKNIPVAAGLGGGSADAAATMTGCMELWNKTDSPNISDDVLAAQLGADVPVCRFGKPAKVGGIGETISPAWGWPPTWLVLVNPRVPLSTADVFNAYNGRFRTSKAETFSHGTFSDFTAFLSSQGNDLTDAACAAAPIVDEVLRELADLPHCALARMSGSGPTCFGMFETQDAADRAAAKLLQKRQTWWIHTTPLRVS